MVYWRELEVLSTGTLTRGAVPDELKVLQYGAAGVDVTVINAVQVSSNQQQKTWKLTWLHRQRNTYTLYTHSTSAINREAAALHGTHRNY